MNFLGLLGVRLGRALVAWGLGSTGGAPPTTTGRPCAHLGAPVRPLAALRPFLRPYRGRIALAGLFLMLAALTTLVLPLALRTGDAVMHVRRTLSFAAIPTILEDIWLPGNAFKGLTTEQMSNYQGPTYAMFELDYGVRMVRAEEKIRAVLADGEQAQLLHTPAGTPLLSVERTAYTYNDVPMELRRGLYRTDTHHYHNELS